MGSVAKGGLLQSLSESTANVIPFSKKVAFCERVCDPETVCGLGGSESVAALLKMEQDGGL